MLLDHPSRETPLIRLALTGANGGYGRTLLAQLGRTPEIHPAVLVDPNEEGLRALLRELGVGADAVETAVDASHARDVVKAGRTALVSSATAVPWEDVDVLVEACGHVAAGHAYAENALASGTHVVMVSKEVDTVVGVDLARRAASADLGYLMADGDQPANLLRMLEWVSAAGLDVVAVGKSSEHDLQLDPATGRVTHAEASVEAPALLDLLVLGDDIAATLAARAEAVSGLKRSAAANACEMTVVAMRTGMCSDVPTMHYPVVRPDELADVYALREDGGLLSGDGVVDVFSALRLPGEASFAGGVFAVVRTGDPVTWDLLRGKGHVVSRNGRYACLYWPYHLMGVETPLTVHAVMAGESGRQPRATALMAARATRTLPTGTAFAVSGHHHEIDGAEAVLVRPDDVEDDSAPYYLLDGARLGRAVEAGTLVRLADLVDVAEGPLRAYLDGSSSRSSRSEAGR